MYKFKLFVISSLLWCTSIDAQEPASVFITAGQSNADGRVFNSELPEYLKAGYRHLHFKNVTRANNGVFEKRTFDNPKARWAFCDVTNYHIEKALKKDFYAIKCTYGGTSIDTAATVRTKPVWCADSLWISQNAAYRGDINTGKSLTKSLTGGFSDCVDVTLAGIEGGFDVKAIMWHQGESDRKKAANYYKNFKDMISFMRNAIYEKTGKEKDKNLPFIFGTVPHKSKQYSREVEEAQKRVASELPNVYCIDLGDAELGADNLHFDAAWTEYIGKLMYNKLVELKLTDGRKVKVKRP